MGKLEHIEALRFKLTKACVMKKLQMLTIVSFIVFFIVFFIVYFQVIVS